MSSRLENHHTKKSDFGYCELSELVDDGFKEIARIDSDSIILVRGHEYVAYIISTNRWDYEIIKEKKR